MQEMFINHLYQKALALFVCLFIVSCGSGGDSTQTPVVEPPAVTTPTDDFTNISLQRSITKAQPMTGIVFWDNHQVWSSANKNQMMDAVALEFSYIAINEIVKGEGIYDWSYIESKLDAIASRNHQAVFRFYYAFPGRDTTVPDYIKNRTDYSETQGLSEGRTTSFPDWTNEELQQFTKAFHTQFSERYDNDKRLAFIQVGFGLWGEYHIYDGPMLISETFPSQAYQSEFLEHLTATYVTLPWSISIDASNQQYSPIVGSNQLFAINFGLFDDSFMHEQHSGYNEQAWNALDYNERYKVAPQGGEFSYVAATDQVTALTPNTGSYGVSYEEFAEKFHVSYMIGNDTYTRGLATEQPISRIKEASINSGYEFTVTTFATNSTSSEVTVKNTGVAPIYYDAFVTVNGVSATESLKGLLPNVSKKFLVSSGGESPTLTIESEHILSTQTIEFNADL